MQRTASGDRSTTDKVLRSPVLHVIVLGLVAFAVYSLAFTGNDEAETVIRITRGDVEDMAAKHKFTFRREPTRQEISSMVESHVREEVLYREAQRLGLDRDDIIIRRRLAQKMDFLSQDIASLVEPTDSAVVEYFGENIEKYRVPPHVTFFHIYFNTDRRGFLEARETALGIRDDLNATRTPPGRAHDRGDRFMLQYHYRAAVPQDVVSQFGASEITDSLFVLSPGAWHGPFASGYGLHLVYVESLIESTIPEFEEVKDAVREDVADEFRRQANEIFYAGLRDNYEIVMDDDLRSELGLDSFGSSGEYKWE